jgi:hypothetical protein
MSFRDPEDRDTYTKETFITEQFSHGRITLEDSDEVINVQDGYIELEKNTASRYDSLERLSIIIRGGKWYKDKKKRNPKNAATFRFPDTKKHAEFMKELEGFISSKTRKLFFCDGRPEEPKPEKKEKKGRGRSR